VQTFLGVVSDSADRLTLAMGVPSIDRALEQTCRFDLGILLLFERFEPVIELGGRMIVVVFDAAARDRAPECLSLVALEE
jgi:hypothetical protein